MSSRQRSSKVKQWKREKLAKRDGGWKCRYCGKALQKSAATLDHIVPLALGGTWRDENLCLACRKCNRMKANQPPHVFHALLVIGLTA